MFFPPSDEEVELELGPRLGTWEPLPAREAANLVVVPEQSVLVNLLTFGAFVLAAAAGIGGSTYWKHPTPGIFSAVTVLGITFYGIIKLSQAQYRRRRPGVFEHGIRYDRDLIRFDNLKLLSLEAPKTVAERYLPTFRKLQRKVDRFPELVQKRDHTRKLSVTPILNDGSHLVWLGIPGIFSRQDLDAFYDLIKERYPEKVFGTHLTDEERRQIEEL